MQNISLTKRLFWIIATFIVGVMLLVTAYFHYQTKQFVESRALSRSKTLETYFMSMRYVYQQQFLRSKIDLNASTIGFLPAHAATYISNDFAKHMKDGTTIRSVSDRPRNPINRADAFEVQAIRYFEQHPKSTEKISLITQNNKEIFFYRAPIKIVPSCIQCHGKKEEVLPYIAKRYDTAYNYKVGDVRGVVSIKIPRQVMANEMFLIFWKEVLLSWVVILFLLGFIYYAIRQITRRDVELKKRLEIEVKERTAQLEETAVKLEKSSDYQKHLFSILRTIADSNQILITAQSLEELVEKTAQCLIANETFLSVRISLLEGDELQLKASYGADDAQEVLSIETMVFECNTPALFTDFTTDILHECYEKVGFLGMTAVYVSALHKNNFATTAFGVMTISTAQPEGFTAEEREMIDELSGDLGFAINSFHQKEDIIKLSFYDSLTELPNRRLLMERFAQAMIASSRTLQYGALLFIDLDHFKGINDLKGHISGDKVLQEMARRLLKTLRQTDTIARFGGDEFVILIENIGTYRQDAAASVGVTADKILEIAKEPFFIDEQPFYLSASIGITLFIDEELTVNQLFAYADSAMYAAKNSGRNTVRFFDLTLQETIAQQARMINDLRLAITLNQLYVVYQEQINVQGVTQGVEALMRWEHPEKGLVPPSYFIPLAESSGIIISLGDWIFNEVLGQIQEWSTDPIKQHWRISVNVSPKQFEEEAYISKLQEKIDHTHINPTRVRLELTEGLLIRDTAGAMEKIYALKKIGFSLSIDDFGTGYSSLSYLKNLPIDELKIDQSFVQALPDSSADHTIIQTIITIGQTFGMEVIAEGVETQEQFDALKQMGCSAFQGYLFSRPQRKEYYSVR